MWSRRDALDSPSQREKWRSRRPGAHRGCIKSYNTCAMALALFLQVCVSSLAAFQLSTPTLNVATTATTATTMVTIAMIQPVESPRFSGLGIRRRTVGRLLGTGRSRLQRVVRLRIHRGRARHVEHRARYVVEIELQRSSRARWSTTLSGRRYRPLGHIVRSSRFGQCSR
jgi:hypothetical protein